MIKKKNLLVRPKKPFESFRIKEENLIVKKYGLKNKREVWKTLAKINYYRRRAKDLANSPQEEKEILFRKLKALGLRTNSIADVLDLKVENLLERRLPTIVVKKGIASTPKQARQMVVHKKILVDNKVMNAPSYIVKVDEEDKISQKESRPKAQNQEAPQ